VNCRCNACDLNLGSLERKTHESIPFVPDTIRPIPCPTWEKYGSSDPTVIAQVLCCKLVAVLWQFRCSFVAVSLQFRCSSSNPTAVAVLLHFSYNDMWSHQNLSYLLKIIATAPKLIF
jgi:hypothetical protein